MMKTTDGSWCWNCWHCIVWDRAAAKWLHISNDDWSGATCTCVNLLVPCSPKRKKAGPPPELKRACGPRGVRPGWMT